MAEFEDIRSRLTELEQVADQAQRAARTAQLQVGASGDEQATQAAKAAQRRAAAADADRLAVLGEFVDFTDPRRNVHRLPDSTPILLLPLRLETRFATVTDEETGRQHPELWVRIYPDDCSVNSFEPELSKGEVEAGTRFWLQYWRAGQVDAESRAAWRNLAGSYGVGRAAWIVESFAPVNPDDRPAKQVDSHLVLVIAGTHLPPEPQRSNLASYWTSVWAAGGDQTKLGEAWTALVNDLGGEAAAQDATTRFAPFNVGDPPPPGRKRQATNIIVAWLQLPAVTGEERLGWRTAPTARALPERFVLTLFPTDGPPFDVLGAPITEPLYLGPDPAGDQIVPVDGSLQIPEPLSWIFDFDTAVAAGMGMRVRLSAEQAARGFNRVVAVGVRMRSDGDGGRVEFEQLLAGHAQSRSGFEILSQGVATNNSGDESTGWSRRDDPDLAYDDVFGPEKFQLQADPLEKRDGQIFAERLGLDPAAIMHVRGADGRDGIEARAMNTALSPGTLGYFVGTMMSPVFDGWEGELSWYFTSYVTGRGPIPAVRIGAQPYGVIASTALSRTSWLERRVPEGRAAMAQSRRWLFLQRLHAVLGELEPLWRDRLGSVSHVGSGADPHQILLGALGLHPNSAEFHIRNGKHLDELVSRGALAALGVKQMAQASKQRQQALTLLRRLGYTGPEPDLLNVFFRARQSALVGPLIEATALSESLELGPATTDGRNYLEWLADTGGISLDALRQQEGFVGDTPPRALLYIMLQFALTRGYLDASDRMRALSGLFEAETLLAMRREPTSIHVREGAAVSESQWIRLYETDARLTGSATTTIAEHLTAVLGEDRDYVVDLAEQIRAVQMLRHAPTGRLERAFVEHLDTLTYRYDSWRLGLVTWQLEQMRGSGEPAGRGGGRGLYLGSYGWLEDVQPKAPSVPTPDLPPELAETFADDRPLMVDPTNGGHLHAPSLNQAVTAAILRAGELANRTPGSPGAFSINLSSERVRQATGLLEGLRTGQSLGALLGYRFERALHDDGGVLELDALVFAFRRAFPLTAGKLAPTQDPPPPASEAIEARNVTDGLALVHQADTSGGYPYGEALPTLSAPERAAVEKIVRDLSGVFDALADVVLAEGIHQTAQNNVERAGAHVDNQGDFTTPPEPGVIRTPTRGSPLSCRFGLELDPSAAAAADAPPRVKAQPALDAWLGTVLPPMSDIACRATWTVPGGAEQSRVVSLADLGLAPIDALELISDEGGSDLAELDDRVREHVISVANPRADATFTIRYMDGPGKMSVFVASALFKRLRGLVLRSRPMRAGDVMPPSQGHSTDATPHVVARTRLSSVIDDLTTLRSDVETAIAAGTALFGDQVGNRTALLSGIDDRIAVVGRLLARVATFGGARAGWGSLYEWRADRFSGLLTRTSELLDRWQERLDACEAALAAEQLPGTSTEDRVILLRAAEGQVSTALAPQSDPVQLRPVIVGKHDAFVTKRDAIRTTVIDAPNPTLSDRLARCQSLLPISDFDPQPLTFDDLADSVVAYWADLQALLTTARADVDGRIEKATEALNAHDAAVDPEVRLSSLQAGAEAVFGEGFRLVPMFTLPGPAGAEQAQAHAHFLSGDLLAKAREAIGVDNPLDTWLYGVARVRPKLRLLEDMLVLWDAHALGNGSLVVAQHPHKTGAPWLALDFPKDDAPDGERMTYVALVHPGYDPAAERCGLLLDEWTETIPAVEPDEPGPQHTTGVAFHFNRPSQEPPQAMLLLTPATWDGAWSWDDIVGGVVDTFDLARLRAVEPDQLAGTPLAQFLPATIASVTTSGLSLGANFALANTDVQIARTTDG